MAFTPTNGNDTAYLIGPGSGTIDFLDGVDTLDMGEAVKSSYTIRLGSDGYVHIDSVSGASSKAQLHLIVKNLELVVWHDGSGTQDLRTLFDTTAPTVTQVSPASHSSAVAVASAIVFSFSEAIQKGSGTVTIRDATGALFASIPISDASVTVSGSQLTVQPASPLKYSTGYTVQLSAGSVKDAAGNALATASTLSFTTRSDPAYTGTAAADVFVAAAGAHVVDGGAGTDTLQLGAVRDAFTLTHGSAGWTVAAKDAGSSYVLSAVERLSFSDHSVALDLDGNAGKAAKILGAVFGADAVGNEAYAGIGLALLDGGMSYEALMQLALDVKLGAGASHKAVVDLLYTNVVGTAPSAADEASFVALLDNHSYTPASLGVMAADTSLNAAHIGLVGLQDTGLPYLPA